MYQHVAMVLSGVTTVAQSQLHFLDNLFRPCFTVAV